MKRHLTKISWWHGALVIGLCAFATPAHADPVPDLLTYSVSKNTVSVNESFTVTISGKNIGNMTAPFGGITTQVRQAYTNGTEMTVNSVSAVGANSSKKIWWKGELLGTQQAAQYLHVEPTWDSWAAGSTKSVTVTLTPKKAGTYEIYTKMYLSDGASPFPRDPSGTSPNTDHQGEATILVGKVFVTTSVSGNVNSSTSGIPIKDATVAYGSSEPNGGSAVTNSQGKYSISNILPGTYSYSVSAPGYLTVMGDKTILADQSNFISFTLTPDFKTLTINPPSLLSWTVTSQGYLYFKANVTDGTNYTLKVHPLTSGSDPDLYLDPSNAVHNGKFTLNSIQVAGKDELIAFKASGSGTLYIAVFGSGASSSNFTIEMKVNNSPNNCTLVAPPQGATNVKKDVVLDWSCTDPDGDTLVDYYLELDDDSNFSSPLTSGKIGSSNSSWQPSANGVNLQPGTTYFWRVYAIDQFGFQGKQWTTWNFTVEPLIQTYSGHVSGNILPVNGDSPLVSKDFAHHRVVLDGISSPPETTTNNQGNYSLIGTANQGVKFELKGTYVDVNNDVQADLSTTIATSPYDQFWNLVTTNQAFDEINAFYHINLIHDYFQSLASNYTEMDFSLPVYVNALDGGTYYCPVVGCSQERIHLGGAGSDPNNGGRSFAQDAEVIYHEYTHGVHNHFYSLASGNPQTEAIGEALGDYFASSYLNKNFGLNPVLGDWIMVDTGSCSSSPRNLENKLKVNLKNLGSNDDWEGEEHCDGRIFGGALWDLRQMPGIGDLIADRLVFHHLNLHPIDFMDSLLSVLQTDDDPAMGYGGDGILDTGTPHELQIRNAFGMHGIYEEDELEQIQENDEFAKAVEIAVGSSFLNDLRAYDEDWYWIQLESGEKLTVEMDLVHNYGDLDLQLYDANETLLESSTSSTNQEVVKTPWVNNTSFYYLRVYGAGGEVNSYSLDLQLSEQPKCPDGSMQDSVGDPCVHNDCADGSLQDSIGNTCNHDEDNDGVADGVDAFPFDGSESIDTDGDGIGNNADLDDDNDGVPDTTDDFPLDAGKKVYRWLLNDGTGCVADDSGNQSKDGTLLPTCGANTPQWISALSATGLEFDGIDDSVRTPLPYTNETDLTVSAWYQTNVDYVSRMALVGGNNGGRFEVYVDNGRPGCRVWDTKEWMVFTDEVIVGGWHQVVCVQTMNPATTLLYVDGILKKTTNHASVSAGGRWLFGKPGSTAAHSYKGKLDEVKMWNYALSATEIQSEFNAYVVPEDPGSDEVVPHEWSFEEGNGCQAMSSTGIAGTLSPLCATNVPLWTSAFSGNGLDFDGIDDFVSTPLSYTNETDLSIAAWYQTDITNVARMTLVGGNNGGRFEVYVDKGRPGCRVWDANAAIKEWTIFTNEVYVGDWHQVVCVQTMSSASTSPSTSLYVDGVLKKTVPHASVSAGGKWFFGKSGSSAAHYYNGLLDEIQIWPKALTAEEVMNLYSP